MSRYEQETIINYNQEEDLAEVYTCDKSLQRRLAQLAISNSCVQLIREDEHSQTYKFPKKWVKVKMSRQLSDEKRSELAELARRNFHGGGKEE